MPNECLSPYWSKIKIKSKIKNNLTRPPAVNAHLLSASGLSTLESQLPLTSHSFPNYFPPRPPGKPW
jgi:hypothetical protein